MHKKPDEEDPTKYLSADDMEGLYNRRLARDCKDKDDCAINENLYIMYNRGTNQQQ